MNKKEELLFAQNMLFREILGIDADLNSLTTEESAITVSSEQPKGWGFAKMRESQQIKRPSPEFYTGSLNSTRKLLTSPNISVLPKMNLFKIN